MKTAHDPRHLKRVKLMRGLFSWEYQKEGKFFDENIKQIIKNINVIDKEIEKSAPSWPISKINKIDLAILRLAVFELIISKDVPYKVTVDEAVELGKEYGSEASPAFINGVLGKIIGKHGLDQKTD